VIELSRIAHELKGALPEGFQNGPWHGLAGLLAEGSRCSLDTIRVDEKEDGGSFQVEVRDPGEGLLFSYNGKGPSRERFLSRFDRCRGDQCPPGHRGAILDRLIRYTLSENERIMAARGFRTRRQTFEASLWFRMAYHAYLEYGNRGCRFSSRVAESSGDFHLLVDDPAGTRLFSIHVPRNRIAALIEWAERFLPGQRMVRVHPVPLECTYQVRLNDEKDLELICYYRFTPKKGPPIDFKKEELTSQRYGDLVFLKEPGVFATVAPPNSRAPRITDDDKLVVKRSRVPAFLDQFRQMLSQPPYELDAKVQRLRIFKDFDSATIDPGVLRRDWCWLSVSYQFGKTHIGLREILRAKREGDKFLETPEGWVDVEAAPMSGIDSIADLPLEESLEVAPEAIRMRPMDLFRVQATSSVSFQIVGEKERAAVLEQVLQMKPAAPMPPMRGVTSQLRAYQQIGVEWLWFLYSNGFGGCLCDDMGLGKTHQAMALMGCLKAEKESEAPKFLVVCPTTVLSHWEQKIKAHAPGLSATIYHGGGRDLSGALKDSDVLLTSYGILRRDIAFLSETVFALVVFDEIQSIKNAATQSFMAAARLQARMKLGMTGTPIENTLCDLKAIMDLNLPGYLGSDAAFRERYITALKDEDLEKPRKEELSRLISPFTLRRKKESVLQDLPEKIEDIRTCRLSGVQADLYREAIELRAEGIMAALKDPNTAVPYIHIFALLTLLKQICDHPALVRKSPGDDAGADASGKWELFKELLSESLDSGQKVVIYSQFLGMIQLMKKYLADRRIGHVTLTGASRNRGELIRRFNEDADCRVYVGSLKAGGTGVDLIGGSVVIHYDRWWNAAKEDQATDRVHRIGQTRGVQVFKLVTEGTLEEKISAIIMKKRNLMDSIVREDDPNLLKNFSREDLIAMLSLPQGELMRDLEDP
jgi:SNF2 family DNA or RNA helicase